MKKSITYSIAYHISYLILTLFLYWSEGMPVDAITLIMSYLLYLSIGLVVHGMLFYAGYSLTSENLSATWVFMLLITMLVMNLFNYPFIHKFITLELFRGRVEYFWIHILIMVSVSIAVLAVKRIREQ